MNPCPHVSVVRSLQQRQHTSPAAPVAALEGRNHSVKGNISGNESFLCQRNGENGLQNPRNVAGHFSPAHAHATRESRMPGVRWYGCHGGRGRDGGRGVGMCGADVAILRGAGRLPRQLVAGTPGTRRHSRHGPVRAHPTTRRGSRQARAAAARLRAVDRGLRGVRAPCVAACRRLRVSESVRPHCPAPVTVRVIMPLRPRRPRRTPCAPALVSPPSSPSPLPITHTPPLRRQLRNNLQHSEFRSARPGPPGRRFGRPVQPDRSGGPGPAALPCAGRRRRDRGRGGVTTRRVVARQVRVHRSGVEFAVTIGEGEEGQGNLFGAGCAGAVVFGEGWGGGSLAVRAARTRSR
jgi:hypothetical protein